MARKGRRSTNEERANAIRLLQKGYTRAEVANILEVAEPSVYDWQSKFRKGGLAPVQVLVCAPGGPAQPASARAPVSQSDLAGLAR